MFPILKSNCSNVNLMIRWSRDMQQEEVLIAQNLNQFIRNATITECILGNYTLKKSKCEVVIFISHI